MLTIVIRMDGIIRVEIRIEELNNYTINKYYGIKQGHLHPEYWECLFSSSSEIMLISSAERLRQENKSNIAIAMPERHRLENFIVIRLGLFSF